MNKINLPKLLDWITGNVYDEGHGLLGPPSWVVQTNGLLDHLCEQTGISQEKMSFMFDEARFRVHGGKGEEDANS